MQQEVSEIELINRVLSGNTAVYAELVKRQQRFVFTLAMRFVKNREDAEEVSQDCFIKAYRSLAKFQQTAKFSTWLYSIVYTTSMSFLRKKRLETTSIDDGEGYIQVEDHTAESHTLAVEQKITNEYLGKAIDMLLPDDATIITLFYKAEQSLEEIASITGMETNTVKVKLHRARQRLRTRLEHLLKEEVKELI
jgi:RNA polymerase sigma-70 factor (ECF subfamily)